MKLTEEKLARPFTRLLGQGGCPYQVYQQRWKANVAAVHGKFLLGSQWESVAREPTGQALWDLFSELSRGNLPATGV